MKTFLTHLVIGFLALVGGVLGAALTRTLVPVSTYIECKLHSCEDEWVVTRYLRGGPGKGDTRWYGVWNVKTNLPYYTVDETTPASLGKNTIDLTVNPLKLNQEYEIATAKYGHDVCKYNGSVQQGGDWIKICLGSLRL
jgi:hypothetical protein